MKKTYTLIISFFLISGTIFSQITVPDFTLTDIDGNSYNLYQELAEGKTVVLDFFALQCGTCQTGIAYVENVWQTFGSNGDDLWVWAIESSGGTNLDIQDFVQVNGGSFPGFSITENDTLYSFFNITYTPQYFVICPNGQIKSCAVDQVGNYVEACIGLSIAPGQQESNIKSAIESISAINSIEIIFSSNTGNRISFDLYDLLGNKIAHADDFFPRGTNTLLLSKTGLARGYYFVRMFEAGRYVSSKKFVIQ